MIDTLGMMRYFIDRGEHMNKQTLPPKNFKRNVQTVHQSKETFDELERYLGYLNALTGISEGRAYVQALTEKMDRERDAGRWS
jgi:hypothetical protein